MFNLDGVFKKIILSMILLVVSCVSYAESEVVVSKEKIRWKQFSKEVRGLRAADHQNGLSYIISGSVALAGGLLGEGVTSDSVEKGIYTVFQSIGIASIGYGAYLWKVGGEERALYDTLRLAKGLSSKEKSLVLKAYSYQKKEKKRKERLIKAITHGLVAGLNIYNGSRQAEDGVRNALYFVGGVNLLAAATFTFEF